MYKYLQKLQQKRLFNKQYVTEITGSARTAENVLQTYQKYGLICKVRRDLYCILNLATGTADVSKYEIATALSSDSCVAYHAALEFHGLGHQLWNEVTVHSSTQFVPFTFEGISYSFHKSKNNEGIEEPTFASGVKVTSLERTIVDCCAHMDLAGGYEEVMHCLEAVTFVNEKKLIEVLRSYNAPVTWKKVGYVMESINERINLSTSFFNLCKEMSSSAVNFLTNKEECTHYISKWKLYIPETSYNNTTNEII